VGVFIGSLPLVVAGRAEWVRGEAEPQVAELGAVGDEVDLGDLAVCHGEPEHAQWLVPGAAEGSGGAVDGGGDRVRQEAWRGAQDVLGDRLRAGELERRDRAGSRVKAEHYLGCQQFQQALEVAAAGRGEEGVDGAALDG